MSANSIGSELLGRVKKASLLDTLQGIRKSRPKRHRKRLRLGVETIDRFFSILADNNHLPQNPVIEITSLGSGDGKTSVLYHIVAIAVLPEWFDKQVFLGGRGAAVVWMDTDGRFDAHRFKRVMSHLLQERLKPFQVAFDEKRTEMASRTSETILEEAMRHVHVFRPKSSAMLLRSLETLPDYLFGRKHYSHKRQLHSIVIDSASAYYHQDCWEREIAKIPGGRQYEEARSHGLYKVASEIYSEPQKKISTRLKELQNLFSCFLLFTTTGFYPFHLSPPYVSFRSYLPYPWPNLTTLRLVVCRDKVPRFPRNLSMKDAVRHAPARQQAVRKGRFSGWVDPACLPFTIRGKIQKGIFKFNVFDQGVTFDRPLM